MGSPKTWFNRFPAVDRTVLSEPATVELFRMNQAESYRQGAEGALQEMVLVLRKQGWEFDPYTLLVPLDVFVGEEDASKLFAARLAEKHATLHRMLAGESATKCYWKIKHHVALRHE